MTIRAFTLANGKRVIIIGDPHLGKVFPAQPHRQGERELLQKAQFVEELDADYDIIILVGDLFDNPTVSREVELFAARALEAAAERNTDTLYLVMAGNHDQPRNMGTVGVWPTFKGKVENRFPNLIVVDRPLAIEGIALFPWEWNRRADDQVADLADADGIEHAVGHWDLAVFDGKDDHLAPTAALAAAFPELSAIWSGHYHKPGMYPVGEWGVICVGSMQPYAHGEGDLYVTLTREEALTRTDLRDKVVRVILAPGEDMPEIDCLSLTHKREREETESEETTTSLQDFDFSNIVRERIADLDPTVRSFIEERMSLAPEEQRRGSD